MTQAPTSLQTSVTSLAPTLAALPGAKATNKTALDSVNYSYAPGQLSSAATAAGAVQAALDNALNNKCVVLTVHPWTYGAAETGQGLYTKQAAGYLSQQQAYNFLAQKLVDAADSQVSSIQDLFCLAVFASSEQSFAEKLASLNAVFPLPGLELCQRRINQLLNIEQSKINRKVAATLPCFAPQNKMNFEKIKALKEKGDSLTAICQAYASDVNPIKELKNVIDDKISESSKAATEWHSLLSSFSGGGGEAFFLISRLISDLARQVKNKPVQVNNFCALVALGGPSGSLAIFQEIFNL